MIDIYAVAAVVGIITGFIAVIGVVITALIILRSEIAKVEARLKTEMTDLKTDIKSIDDRQRRMQDDVSYIKGSLAIALPGFRQGMETPTAQEEQVGEAVGD